MRLVLKPTLEHDLEKIIDWEQHPDNHPFVCSYSLERHRQVISDADERHLKLINPQNEMIGFVLLAGMTHQHRFIELKRIVIAEKGQGYGRGALRLIKQFAFEEAHCHRLWLDVYDFNQRARKLYLSEGFKEDGILTINDAGEGNQNLVLMSLLQS